MKKSKRHKWEDLGIAPNSLGVHFGDKLLRCGKCGKELTYARIDDNLFRPIMEGECKGFITEEVK